MNGKIKITAAAISMHLDAIKSYFKPGAKVALAVWYDGRPDLDFTLVDRDDIMGNLNGAAETFHRRANDPHSLAGWIKPPREYKDHPDAVPCIGCSVDWPNGTLTYHELDQPDHVRRWKNHED